MKLEKIITMANRRVEIEFRVMERSLRETGCKLPILVIPYDDDLFDLPSGSEWWIIPELNDWLRSRSAMPKMRKYQCFLTDNYQFVDSDICFLKNPEEVLEGHDQFITSCLHWSNPVGTYTDDSLKLMKQQTTIWPSIIFNSGQFASSVQLYDMETLIKTASQPDFVYTCIDLYRDQPSINMLVYASGVQIHNLTLPPYNMQSTWAGDYDDDYQKYWSDKSKMPYIIHWAGLKPSADKYRSRKIDDLFLSRLTESERIKWAQMEALKRKEERRQKRSIRYIARKVKKAIHVLVD